MDQSDFQNLVELVELLPVGICLTKEIDGWSIFDGQKEARYEGSLYVALLLYMNKYLPGIYE